MTVSARRAATGIAIVLVVAVVWWAVAREFYGTHGVPGAQPVVETITIDGDGLTLPKRLGSLRFAVMGDVGRGDQAQFDTAAQMALWRERFDFAFVLMLGDNIYADGTPDDYVARFEQPYKPLLDAGVTFYAANGNHDPPNILTYAPFNMNGNRYYTFTKEEGALGPIGQRTVRFFAIDTVNLDRAQLAWLREQMGASSEDWEICFYHHPLYTSGRYKTNGAWLRRRLEPVLVQFGADVALAGHEHFYERIVPQRGISHFTSGGGGALRKGDIRRPSSIMAAGYDEDTHFMLMEISGDDLWFQAISRTGQTVDAGRITRPARPQAPPSIK